MAMTLSNHFKYQLGLGNVDLSTDSIVIILMGTGWTFDKDAHATYTDISANELTGSNGYTQKTKTLTYSSGTENDTDDRAEFVFGDATWTASGGSLGGGAISGYVLIDDTTGDDTVIGAVEYASEITVPDGQQHQIKAPEIRIA